MTSSPWPSSLRRSSWSGSPQPWKATPPRSTGPSRSSTCLKVGDKCLCEDNAILSETDNRRSFWSRLTTREEQGRYIRSYLNRVNHLTFLTDEKNGGSSQVNAYTFLDVWSITHNCLHRCPILIIPFSGGSTTYHILCILVPILS